MSEAGTAGGAPAAAAPAAATGGQNAGAGQGQAPKTAGPATPSGVQGDSPAPTAAERRLLAEQDRDAYIEHTVNGKKEQIKIADALKSYGLDKTANFRAMQAANEMKRAQQLQHLMVNDFDKWCEVTGTDKDAFLRANLSKRKEIAEEILAREYELQQMDPNQRKALELEQQLQQFKTREMQTKQPLIDQIKQLVPAERLPRGLENATADELRGFLQARQQEFNQGLDQMSNELLAAWQSVGLPKEKDFGAWMAQTMLDHDRRAEEHRKKTGETIPPLQPEQAALRVKQRFLDSTRSLLSQMDAPAIQEVLGEAIVQKLRDHDVGLASSHGPKFGNQNRPEPIRPASEPKKQLNQMEWRKQMGLA